MTIGDLKPIGFVILDKLKYNAKNNLWEHSKVHSPNSARTYTATAKIKADGTLEVHGWACMKFLGRKKYFKRVE